MREALANDLYTTLKTRAFKASPHEPTVRRVDVSTTKFKEGPSSATAPHARSYKDDALPAWMG